MGIARFMISMLAGLAANGTAIAIAEMALDGHALPGALVGMPLGAWLAFRINEAGNNPDGFDRRRLRPTIAIAFLFALAIHAAMLLHLDGLRPLASFVLCAIAALVFAAIGYWRFFARSG